MSPEDSYNEFLDRIIGPLPAGEEDVSTPGGLAPRGVSLDDTQADRALRHLKHLQDDNTHDMAFLLAERARLQAWFDERYTRRVQERARVEGLLRAYYEHLKDTGKVYKPARRKSHTPYILPHGTLESYAVREAYEITDAAAFLAWCEENDLTKVEIKPRWGDAKRLFHVDDKGVFVVGDVDEYDTALRLDVPGVHVIREAGESFRVRLQGDEAVDVPDTEL